MDRSPQLRRSFDSLCDAPHDRRSRLIAFYTDIDDSLGPIVDLVRPGGLLVWTTGDRRIGGVKIPMAPILRELLGKRNRFCIGAKSRDPQTRKRMPSRNDSVTHNG